jgi:hypothetical protein
MNVRTFLPVITLCFLVSGAAAQNALPDSLLHTQAKDQVVREFNETIGEQSEIYNGPRYYLLPQAVKGSPYFLGSVTFEPASIQYNGTWYTNVPMLYDAYADLMVSTSRNIIYSFRSEKLTDVNLAGHHFISMDASKSLNLSPGYYDELYGGRSEVVVKRSRTVVKRAGSQSLETLYENKDEIYIKKGGSYLSVSSKHSVLNVFKDKAKQLKEYLSAAHISYRKDKEGSIAKLAAYYDKISQ